jgi:NADPH:quinone reductase
MGFQPVARGELKVEIDRVYRLEEAEVAHAYAESRAAFGRVVLTP